MWCVGVEGKGKRHSSGGSSFSSLLLWPLGNLWCCTQTRGRFHDKQACNRVFDLLVFGSLLCCAFSGVIGTPEHDFRKNVWARSPPLCKRYERAECKSLFGLTLLVFHSATLARTSQTERKHLFKLRISKI